MQFSLWGHKPSLWYLLSLSKNIFSHFMSWNLHKDNKEGGGIFIIFINYYFYFYFLLFFFQFLDSPSQTFYLHQQFMFLGANCLFVCQFFGV